MIPKSVKRFSDKIMPKEARAGRVYAVIKLILARASLLFRVRAVRD
jgi:hypothetical protein